MNPVGLIFKKTDDPEEILNQIVQLLDLHGCGMGVGVHSGKAVMLLGKLTDDVTKLKILAIVKVLHPKAIDWAPISGEPVRETVQ